MEVGNVYQAKNEIQMQAKGMHRWTKICRNKWPLMKNYKSFWKRPKELNLSIMIMFSQKTMCTRSIILYFR
jgi:hypothetical protein